MPVAGPAFRRMRDDMMNGPKSASRNRTLRRFREWSGGCSVGAKKRNRSRLRRTRSWPGSDSKPTPKRVSANATPTTLARPDTGTASRPPVARKTCERLGIDAETRLAPAACVPVLELFKPEPARPRDPAPLSPVDRPLGAPPAAEASRSYRLQFSRIDADGRLSILTEADVPASNVSDAIRSAAHLDWPPLAIGFRSVRRRLGARSLGGGTRRAGEAAGWRPDGMS